MDWFLANVSNIALCILVVAEVLSLFIPGNGTLAGIIKVVAGIPGVKDPQIGK